MDKFPLTKSSLPEDFCFFVSRRGRYGFLSNWLIEDHNGHIKKDLPNIGARVDVFKGESFSGLKSYEKDS